MDPVSARIDPGLRVAAAHLAVSDLQASVDFYVRAMGLRLISGGAESATLGPHEATPLLTLTQLAEPTPASPRSTGLFHLALLHPTRRDLAATVRRLAGAGWRFTGASDHGVSEALYLRDPDGLGLEVYADRPREQWPRRRDGGIDIFTAALDVDDLMATHPESEPDAAIAPGTTLGHVHLQVSDVERSLRFYRDALGLDVVATMPGAAFLATGGYHHHLAVNSWSSRGGVPAAPTAPGLRLVELRLSAPERVDELEARLAAHEVTAPRASGGLLVQDPDGIALAVAA